MGWSRRSPRCRWCWKTGHTKRTCPETPESIKKEYKEANKYRACSHCSKNGYSDQTGHNKRSCIRRKEDREAYEKDVLTYRKLVLEWCKNNNIGVGTVFSSNVPKWARYGELEDAETNIYFIKKLCNITGIEKPQFVCQSTISMSDTVNHIWQAGMPTHISFPSSLERNGEIKVKIEPSNSYYTDGRVQILSAPLEGTELFETSYEDFMNYRIDYPSRME